MALLDRLKQKARGLQQRLDLRVDSQAVYLAIWG